MTFQKMYEELTSGQMSPQEAYDDVKSQMKKINYYLHAGEIKTEPLNDEELQELDSIVNVLAVLYGSDVGSPISDPAYDILEETLVNMGIPRLTGTVEINDSKKLSHTYTTLRGTLEKVYYLFPDEKRTNKSRKTLDEWIASAELLYKQRTGKTINLNETKVLVQPKFDGSSVILEWDGKKAQWLSRGDTANNRASDLTPIMSMFDDIYCSGSEPVGIKFECMCSEESLDLINKLSDKPYKNSRQIVTSTLNSVEPDFKADYLYPVPLRIIHPGEDVEQIHPDLISKFDTLICTLGDRDQIKDFANHHKYVSPKGSSFRLRCDGAVLTILDPNIQRVLGRENAINKFEVAYKFTEEVAYSKVKDVEFYVSEFGHITPVVVVNDVIMKGNTVNHISLANKERFDELNLSYGDTLAIHYDIIPYATIDENCKREPHGRHIDFIDRCPECGAPLDLDVVEVQCKNPDCPSRIVGRILNYCRTLRIKNIGFQTLNLLYASGFLPHGIRSLYKLRNKFNEIQDMDGFGMIKTRKMISEIEAKRKLRDYEFFGAIGIEGLSTKTFQLIFGVIKLEDMLNMIRLKNDTMIESKLVEIPGIGPGKAKLFVDYLNEPGQRKELLKMCDDVQLSSSYRAPGTTSSKGRVVFTGIRPNQEMKDHIEDLGYEPSDSWTNSARMLVVPYEGYQSSKTAKAEARNVPIVPIDRLYEELK